MNDIKYPKYNAQELSKTTKIVTKMLQFESKTVQSRESH